MVRIVGVLCDKQPGPRGADDANTASAAVERITASGLVEMADHYNSSAGLLGYDGQGMQGSAAIAVLVGVDFGAKVGRERVHDDKNGVYFQGQLADIDRILR